MTDNPSIETALKEAIFEANKRELKPKETFWASSLGMCPLRQIMGRAGIESPEILTIQSVFKMRVGTVIGADIQKLLESTGYLDPEYTEKRVLYRSYSGKIDGLTHRINGSAVVEIKTADERAITKPDMPEHYLWQGFLYCLAMDIKTLLLFQVGKNQGLSRNRVYHLDDKWSNKINESIDHVDNLWKDYTENGVIPKHEHRFKWEDNWCPYK